MLNVDLEKKGPINLGKSQLQMKDHTYSYRKLNLQMELYVLRTQSPHNALQFHFGIIPKILSF